MSPATSTGRRPAGWRGWAALGAALAVAVPFGVWLGRWSYQPLEPREVAVAPLGEWADLGDVRIRLDSLDHATSMESDYDYVAEARPGAELVRAIVTVEVPADAPAPGPELTCEVHLLAGGAEVFTESGHSLKGPQDRCTYGQPAAPGTVLRLTLPYEVPATYARDLGLWFIVDADRKVRLNG